MTITADKDSLWADALDPIVRKWFLQGYARRSSLIPALFMQQPSSRNYEEISSIGAIATDAWDTYRISGQVGSADFDQGYKKTYEHEEYPLEITIKRKFVDDNMHAEVMRIPRMVGDSAFVKRETDAASIFNNAFTDTAPYDGADGVGLCSTAHPYSPQKTGSTQSNEGTYSLTKANVATVREAMMAFTDDTGAKVAVTPDLLLVPPELEDEALIIANSLLQPGTADNDLNPQRGRYQVQAWHYLTDTNAWFMIDSALMRFSLDWFDRIGLSIVPKVMDRTIEATWIAYMRYSNGWSDWRWVYGNNPS